MNCKCLVNILNLKKQLPETEKLFPIPETLKLNSLYLDNKLVLNVYPKTYSIIANLDEPNSSERFFINSTDGKLYKYDLNGQNPREVTGNFFIIGSNSENYINKAFKVINGELNQINSFFDGSNQKLFIDNKEESTEGLLILTDDYKIYVRIGNCWFVK